LFFGETKLLPCGSSSSPVFIIATTSGAQIARSFPIQQLFEQLIVLLKMPTTKELKNYKGKKILQDLKLTKEIFL
jgi:hypothetical protein